MSDVEETIILEAQWLLRTLSLLSHETLQWHMVLHVKQAEITVYKANYRGGLRRKRVSLY